MVEQHGKNLESEVNSKESEGFIKKTLKFGFSTAMAVGSTLLSFPVVGYSGILLGAALGAGHIIGSVIKGKSPSIKEMLDLYSAVNLALVPMHYLSAATLPLFPQYTLGEQITKIAYGVFGLNIPFFAIYDTFHWGIKNLSYKGFGKHMSENFWQNYLRGSLILAPSLGAAALGASFDYVSLNAVPFMAYQTARGFGLEEKVKNPHKAQAPAPAFPPGMIPAPAPG